MVPLSLDNSQLRNWPQDSNSTNKARRWCYQLTDNSPDETAACILSSMLSLIRKVCYYQCIRTQRCQIIDDKSTSVSLTRINRAQKFEMQMDSCKISVSSRIYSISLMASLYFIHCPRDVVASPIFAHLVIISNSFISGKTLPMCIPSATSRNRNEH